MNSRSSTSKSGIPLPSASGIPKSRNQTETPGMSRLSAAKSKLQQNVKRKRSSAELLSRVSLAPARNAPNKFVTPSQNKFLSVPSSAQYSRGSIDTVRSSFGGKPGSTTWPNEPSFKTMLIDKILNFLDNSECEKKFDRTMLRSPKGSDFVAIFTFIYSRIQPGYKMASRVEEEIPKILKKLKYPVQIPKSSFLNVGTPHTWPAILAMMGWLIDLIHLFDEADPKQFAFIKDFDDEIIYDELKFNSLVNFFRSRGDDEDDERAMAPYLSEYKDIIEKENDITEEEFKRTQQELKSVQMKLENMNCVQDHLLSYEEKYEKLCEDKQKILNYNEEMKEHISAKDRERAQIDANLYELIDQKKQVVEQIDVLEEMKSHQKLSAAELNMYKNHKSEMAIQMNHLDMEKKNVNDQIWALEMEIAKSRNRLSEACFSFNNLCDEQQLATEKISICKLNPEELLKWNTDILSTIKNEKSKEKQKSFSNNSLLVESKAKINKVQEILKDSEGEKHKLECKQKRLQEEKDFLIKEKEAQEKSLNSELKLIGDKISHERRVSTMSLHELQSRLEEKQKEHEERKKKNVEMRQNGLEIHAKIRQNIREAMAFRNENIAELIQSIKKMEDDGIEECKKIVDRIEKKNANKI